MGDTFTVSPGGTKPRYTIVNVNLRGIRIAICTLVFLFQIPG